MTRSRNTRKTAALVLALGLIQGTLAGPTGNSGGPGDLADWWNSRAERWGAPKEGYHVKTLDTTKEWNEKVEGVYNQHIVADAPKGAAFINKDPADGVSGDYRFDEKTKLFCIPDDKYPAGYPAKPLPDSLRQKVTTALQKAGAGEKDGLPLQMSGTRNWADPVGYNKLAEENDYMLLLFGAGWCSSSCDFMSRLAKYYHRTGQKTDDHKSFDVVYFSCDESEDQFNASYKKMPWKSAPYEEANAEHGLRDQLEGIFPLQKTLPFLVVIDREGEVLTEDGVDALCGKQIKGFPLPDGGEFDDYQKDKKDCPISEEDQIKQLMSAVSKKVNELDEFTLKYYATKVTETDMDAVLSEGDSPSAVRQYVTKKFQKYIHDITSSADYKDNGREKLIELFARLEKEENYPENQVFKVDDRVKILENFKDEGFRLLKDGPGNRPNTGLIKDVRQSGKYTDAIQVKCDDNSMTLKWIKASNYKFIQKMAPKDGRRTQSNRV